MDAPHSIDHARRRRRKFRQASADEAAWATGRTRNRLRMLADPLSSYVSGATIAVKGGKPIG